MFGPIGGPELILILVLALLLFGPRKLPQVGKMIGKALNEFRSVTTEFKTTLDREVALDELKKTRDDLQSAASEVKGAVRGALTEPVEKRVTEPQSEPAAGTDSTTGAERENRGEAAKTVSSDGGSTETN